MKQFAQPVFFDSQSRTLKKLTQRVRGQVGLYACGPTVYEPIHIGNARPFILFMWLRKYFQLMGNEVNLVINVTDVNDKIYAAADRAGVASDVFAQSMTQRYFDDTSLLGLGRPDVEPLVTQSIPEIIDLITLLIDKGHAYAREGDVFFRVRSDESYGALSGRSLDDAEQGEGVESSHLKEDGADFALWKSVKASEDSAWDSPWGRGRPGWHIECSAMAEHHLGAEFEIHGGGRDLTFPHHENEAAQTRCGSGHELAQIWMHNGMLTINGEKMSKTDGNIVLLFDAIKNWGREVVLYMFATAHYRSSLDFSDSTMEQVTKRIARLREHVRMLEDGPSPESLEIHVEAFFDALADDFDTPAALVAIGHWLKAASKLSHVGNDHLRLMLSVFGLDTLLDEKDEEADSQATELLAQRNAARKNKDWAAADEARDALTALGWSVRDGAEGSSLVKLDSTE